jgi:CHASE3 domain sensor protein
VKDIASDLNKIENNVRLFSVTGDPAYITPYRQLNASVQDKLSNLKDYEICRFG